MMAPVKRTRVSSCPPTLAKVRESADAPFRSSGSPSRPIGVSDAGVQSGISGAREVEESRRGRGRTPGIAKDRVAVEDDAREGGGHVARRDAVDALRTGGERQRSETGTGGEEDEEASARCSWAPTQQRATSTCGGRQPSRRCREPAAAGHL